MDYAYARQALNYAGKIGLNDGRFAFIMFELDLDLTGNKMGNLSKSWESDSKNTTGTVFESALLISLNNNVSKEYLAFADDVKKKSSKFPFDSPASSGNMVRVGCSILLFTLSLIHSFIHSFIHLIKL